MLSRPLLPTAISGALLAVILLVLSAARSQNKRTQQIKSSLARLEVQAKRPGADHSKESAPTVSTGRGLISMAPAASVGSEFEYASRMETMQSHFETFALRSRSRLIRDSFARAATAGTMGYADLARTLAVIELGSASEESIQQVKTWRSEPLLALARLAANQRSAELDVEDAARLFACVEKNFGTKALGRNDRLLYVEEIGRAHV